MDVAIPVVNGIMTERIFLCEAYCFVKVDPATHQIIAVHNRVAPPLSPEHLPDWLVKMGATVVIAWGMNTRLRNMCEYHGLHVVLGVEPAPPEQIVLDYAKGLLRESA